MTSFIIFVALPYAALLIFIIGSVYRYRAKGFSVSSLSSQFLEGRQLFWGSQPFHWGMMVLFFGHLIAFLIPRAVILWNGRPVRLMILEVTAFVFGLLALLGLLLLIRRRLTSKRAMIVTSKSDAVVYFILLNQLISGLMLAYTVRWGSAWFAGVLSPYLKSLFVFSPQVAALDAMPLVVKWHVVSAFVLIGVIPFTRFMHFLVAPVDYIWRRYQLVIWNWDRKEIRNPNNTLKRVEPRNH